MNPDTLAALMASDAPHAVLDLRERGAYQRGHIFRQLPRCLGSADAVLEQEIDGVTKTLGWYVHFRWD